MELPSLIQRRSNGSPEQRATQELVERILKLRWSGMEDDAERMQLACRELKRRVTLLAGPCDTD